MMKCNVLAAVICFGLAACGGGSSSDSDDDPAGATTQTGVFLDSPVINIGYRTESLEGVTNSSGEYEYLEGETVTFFIGDLELPAVTATGIVTPLDIAGNQDTSDDTVVNIIRLLQTLDEDGNPDNGITITDTAKSSAIQLDFELSVSAFEASTDVINLVANAGSSNVSLISVDNAISHFEEQLENNELSFGALDGVWEVPNESTIFMYLPDGRYFAIQWEEENGFIGFERGTYQATDTEVSFTTLQNNDGEALTCNEPSSTTCSNQVWAVSTTGDTQTVSTSDSGPFTFERRIFSDNSIQGVWEVPNESTIFMYLPDGRYFAIQWEEENGFIGFERGTYQATDTEVSFTTLQNNDGEALTCNEPSSTTCSNQVWAVSTMGDTQTVSTSDSGPFTFERLF
jgi:hypothetical protein